MTSTIRLDELSSPHLPAPVPFAVLTPARAEPMPLCLLLFGGGGTRDALVDLQPVFENWWNEQAAPPMIVAVPSPGLDYYLEEREGPVRWESFLSLDFLPHLRATCDTTGVAVAAGISAGGYGALKLAFGAPEQFAAVAALQPMLEPGLRESDVGPRNRLHHVAGGPSQLIGLSRDAAVWEANNPANRAVANREAIAGAGLAIYIEAAEKDFLNAHDGAEFLHRTLWDLDLSHEYRLIRGADHGGPSLRPRLREMFRWLGAVVSPAAPDGSLEEAAIAWLQSGMQGKPPAGATTTQAFLDAMRARFEPLRQQTGDEGRRRFGRLA